MECKCVWQGDVKKKVEKLWTSSRVVIRVSWCLKRAGVWWALKNFIPDCLVRRRPTLPVFSGPSFPSSCDVVRWQPKISVSVYKDSSNSIFTAGGLIIIVRNYSGVRITHQAMNFLPIFTQISPIFSRNLANNRSNLPKNLGLMSYTPDQLFVPHCTNFIRNFLQTKYFYYSLQPNKTKFGP